MAQILDAMGHPPAAAVKAAGYAGIAAYFSTPGNPKNLTPSLTKAYSAEGLYIVSVFETAANRALAGQAAGQVDAAACRAQALGCGAPDGAVLYAAVDFAASVKAHAVLLGADVGDPVMATATLTAIGAYFEGWESGLGSYRSGAYGDAAVIDFLFNQGRITHGWQTVAWSGGARSARACLYQRAQQVSVGGVTCDLNDVLMADFGGWRIGQVPTPLPLPGPPVYGPTYEEDIMQQATATVQIRSGHGYCAAPFPKVVSVVVEDIDPATAGHYVAVPGFCGVTGDDRLVFGPGPDGPVPDGNYGVVVWGFPA